MKGTLPSVQSRLLRVFLKVVLSTSHDASEEVSIFPHRFRNLVGRRVPTPPLGEAALLPLLRKKGKEAI